MGIKLIFKQLFCNHVYKHDISEYLRTETIMSNSGNMVDVEEYKVSAEYYTCIKCNKEKISTSYNRI